MSNGDNIVEIKEERMNAKGTAPLIGILKHNKNNNEKGGRKKVIAIIGFLLRLGAIAASLGAATTMGTSGQTLPFFTQFFQFDASYDDLPTFQFFVIAMAIVAAYSVLSLPFSIVSIIRPHAVGPKLLLIFLDTVVLTLATSASAAGTAVVYLAHNGNANANWLAICQNYADFCQQVSGAVVSSFIAVVTFVLLIILSACSLRKN